MGLARLARKSLRQLLPELTDCVQNRAETIVPVFISLQHIPGFLSAYSANAVACSNGKRTTGLRHLTA